MWCSYFIHCRHVQGPADINLRAVVLTCVHSRFTYSAEATLIATMLTGTTFGRRNSNSCQTEEAQLQWCGCRSFRSTLDQLIMIHHRPHFATAQPPRQHPSRPHGHTAPCALAPSQTTTHKSERWLRSPAGASRYGQFKAVTNLQSLTAGIEYSIQSRRTSSDHPGACQIGVVLDCFLLVGLLLVYMQDRQHVGCYVRI
jgi:hypothetical protein